MHLRDVLGLPPNRRQDPLPAALFRPLPVLAEETGLRTVLDRMRRNGEHLAQVTDVGGTLLGVITLEDVIEQLVGEVRDATRR